MLRTDKPLKLIVARDAKYGIGCDGKIPWRCTADMIHFKKTTTETVDPEKYNAIIMGRRTWESIKTPLPGRKNIVLSSKKQTIDTYSSLEDALTNLDIDPCIESIFIIGGEQVYRKALEKYHMDELYITIIEKIFPTDRWVKYIPKYCVGRNITLLADHKEYKIWKYF